MPSVLHPNFAAALALPGLAVELWLEIEGIRWAFGNVERDATFFAGRPAPERRLGVRALMTEIPAGVEQEVRPREGTCSVGRLTVTVGDDVDGTTLDLVAGSARSDAWLRLSADLPASLADLASLTVAGTPDSTLYPAAGGVIWCGRECLSYSARAGSTFTSIGRMAHRMPGQTERHAHTAGDVVSPYPRFLTTRRCALYLTLDGTDAAKKIRWLGNVSDARAVRGLTAIQLDLDSLDQVLQADLFSRQRRGKLAIGVTDDLGTYQGSEGDPAPTTGIVGTGAYLQLLADSLSGAAWVDGQRLHFRVGDEYLSGRLQVATTRILIDTPPGDGRGLFGSRPAEHAPGEEVIEILTVVGRDASGAAEHATSFFTAGSHPLDLVLQLLLSRDGDGANGSYDVLPSGIGLGVDQAIVDIASVQALRDLWMPGERFGPQRVEQRTSFSEWAAGVLRACCCYPLTEGTYSIGRRNEPIPGLAVRQLDATAILSVPEWDANWGSVVGGAIFRCDYDPANKGTERSPYRSTYRADFTGPGTEAQEFYARRFAVEVLESDGHWSGLVGGFSSAADDVAQRWIDCRRIWDAQPWPLLQVEASIEQLDLLTGEFVALSLDHVPNVATGQRGLAGALCVILRKEIDEGKGVVAFTLAHTALRTSNGRTVSPAATLVSRSSADLTVHAHDYTDPAGSAFDADFFRAGDAVAIWSPDLQTQTGAGTIVSAGGTLISLSAAPVGVNAGDVVLPAAYSSQGAPRKALSAFLAGAGGTIAGDRAHTFVG
jgi:hypothetical protein